MARDSALNVSVGIIAAVMVCVAAYQASEVFAPLALALFIIALVWPLQSWLQARIPALLALAITMTVTVAVCIAFASLSYGALGAWACPCSPIPRATRRSTTARSAGLRIVEFRSLGYGASISMSAGSSIGRARSPAASTPR